MREGCADAAAVEVDGLVLLAAGKDHTPTEGVTALAVDQPYLQQPIEGIAKGGEMAPQVSAGSIAEAQRFDEGGIAQSALFQISNRLGVAVELKLIESCCLPQ
ncbi:MAG TPA: hypothetical protein VIX37_04675 [Candidatus Sulfotelmatobacter sp.]